MADRVSFVEAATAARDVLRRAAGESLGPRQYRVLCAVVALTALYSKLHDRVYLAQVAAFAFGVTEAEDWMLKKTRETLLELAELGLVESRAPRGRPNVSDGAPRYFVAITPSETDPTAGSDTEETNPTPGSDSEEKRTPPWVGNRPHGGSETDPATGTPTGESSGETSAAAAEGFSERDLEIHRRVRAYEARTGEVAGPGLRKSIGDEVDAMLAADELLEGDLGSGPRLAAMIRAAEQYGARFARVWSRQEFEEELGNQRDWIGHPEVIEAAVRAYEANKRVVY